MSDLSTVNLISILNYNPSPRNIICQIPFQARRDKLKDALLSDVCIGTSAAPTYLPAHCFKTEDSGDKTRSCNFNLIDGGVAANNPVSRAYIFFHPYFLVGNHY